MDDVVGDGRVSF